MAKKKKGKKSKDKKSKGKSKSNKTTKPRELDVEAATRTGILECKLTATERSRAEYRDTARKLLAENDLLQSQMSSTERDTIEVISYLKKEDLVKDKTIEQLQSQVKNLKLESRKERESLIEDFTYQINNLEKQLKEKKLEADGMIEELAQVKDFRKKKNEMQKELDELRDLLFHERKQARDSINTIEHKYFEEKLRLQSEASRQIAELAERAHHEAVQNLDETTRNVYKENVKLTDSLALHLKESEDLKKIVINLQQQVERLSATQEMNENITREKVQQVKAQRKVIKEKQDRIESLEKKLQIVISESQCEKEQIVAECETELYNSKQDISTLKKAFMLKEQELKHIKRLGKRILEQRTDTEQFFLTALDQVRGEIDQNRKQYRKDAKAAYNTRMVMAQKGQGPYPLTRTFRKFPHSTNSVYTDLEDAERFDVEVEYQDISELSWEQKEKVLRLLFADMNGIAKRTAEKAKNEGSLTLPPIEESGFMSQQIKLKDKVTKKLEKDTPPENTFLTEKPNGEYLEQQHLPHTQLAA